MSISNEKMEMLVQQNAEAISALAKTVKELANTMAKEDKETQKAIQEMAIARQDCDSRMKMVITRLEDKKVILTKKVDMAIYKRDIDYLHKEVDFINKILWTLGIGTFALIGKGLYEVLTRGV